ncbi:TolC family protein [Spirosoma oryzicola]|uniref:TolC family protein n=1 Tax=Spirosoma oryzicola TaxID=2898794 RepID=UPI001E2D0D83|nr:TolC family protein [Spirosoma oryzicola]UHG89039.1 TolC family protein [Spirosoma oryzicola]
MNFRTIARKASPAFVLGWLLTIPTLFAQTVGIQPDTVQQTLPQLEQQFLDRNFQLLAQRYQISVAEANVIQAGLRYNPNVQFQSNFFNPQTGKFFQYGQNSAADVANSQFNRGGMTIQVQQLLMLAGKRSKLVAVAESNRALAALAFRDILRTLRYQLNTTYANLFYDLQAVALLRGEEGRQQQLIESYRIAQRTGGVAPYEVTRLEAALRDLRATIANYQSQIADEQATLRVLLRQTGNRFILPTDVPVATPPLPQLSVAIDSALHNRPDAAIALEQINYAERSLSLEKARRTPDLLAGFVFDKYGNAFNNFTGLYTAMDLPIRNRNQGAIKAAEFNVKSSQAGADNQQTIVQSDVLNAYDKLSTYYNQYSTLPTDYISRLQNISVEATRSYNARTIGLLDYLDKIRTYQQAQLNLINLRNNLFQSQQLLNFVTSTRFY